MVYGLWFMVEDSAPLKLGSRSNLMRLVMNFRGDATGSAARENEDGIALMVSHELLCVRERMGERVMGGER